MNGILFQQDPSLYVFGVAARNFSLRLKRSLTQGGVLSKEVLSKPQVATALLRIKPVVVQVKQTLTFHLPGTVERCAKLAPATCHTLKILPADLGEKGFIDIFPDLHLFLDECCANG